LKLVFEQVKVLLPPMDPLICTVPSPALSITRASGMDRVPTNVIVVVLTVVMGGLAHVIPSAVFT
jgi:hypothetical protein